jgi:hypothetical protein
MHWILSTYNNSVTHSAHYFEYFEVVYSLYVNKLCMIGVYGKSTFKLQIIERNHETNNSDY